MIINNLEQLGVSPFLFGVCYSPSDPRSPPAAEWLYLHLAEWFMDPDKVGFPWLPYTSDLLFTCDFSHISV